MARQDHQSGRGFCLVDPHGDLAERVAGFDGTDAIHCSIRSLGRSGRVTISVFSNPSRRPARGAIVFLPSDGRWFVLCFGHVAHSLLDTSYEYDFGLRVTLNSLDPKKLTSTDTLDPGASKRHRCNRSLLDQLSPDPRRRPGATSPSCARFRQVLPRGL